MASVHSQDLRNRRQRQSAHADAEDSVASAPAEIHIAYEADSPEPRQCRPNSKSKPSEDQQQQEEEDAQNLSFPDQLAASALSGTIEFLKVAGGLTLNATGKVVAPPLHVAQTVLLPALWAASVDYVSSRTPKRAKDWFRIISSSVYHFINVLRETEKGQVFRQRLLLLGGDLLDCLSADTTRQVLIDGMAGVVKLIEAIHTPESKAFLDQFTVLCCRLTQVAASGRSQQAMHDAKSLVWSGVELLSDPRSTTALAEVTAYLCHALEMEDAILDGSFGTNQQRSDRRRERDGYQKETFQQKTTLMTNPGATVEQVILSSLGGGGSEPAPGCEESDALSSPDIYSDNMTASEGKVFTSDAGSIRKQVEDAASLQTEEEWHEQAQKNVNVPFLQKQISKRAERRAGRDADIPRDIPVVTSFTEEETTTNIPERQGTDQGEGKPDLNDGSHLQTTNDDAMERFYKVLDSVVKEKRLEGLDHILSEYTMSADKVLQDGKVHKQEKKDNQPHDVLADTIRNQLSMIRQDINKGLDRDDREKLKQMETMIQRNSWVAYLIIAAVIGFVCLWIGFACYGVYTFLAPTVQNIQAHTQETLSQVFNGGSHSRPVADNEIVIRLVREVVHTDPNGIIFDRSPDPTELSRERMEKIAACMSQSLDEKEG